MKKGSILLTALAVILAAGMVITPALAYFTAHTEASGAAAISLGTETEITEDVVGLKKTVSVSNKGPQSCWVRVKAIGPDGIELKIEGSGWSADGEYYVYDTPIAAGGSTGSLVVEILADDYEAEDLNVIVVYESTAVTYDSDGNAEAPEWNMAAIIVE